MYNTREKETVEEVITLKEVVLNEKTSDSAHKKTINKLAVIIISLLLLSFLSYFFLPAEQQFNVKEFLTKDNYLFCWMLLAGFCAEIVAGSMGMGYGVMCTTVLMLLGVPPPVISASIHSAESFTSAAGSISHWRLGNVNKKLVKSLAIPAIIGAVLGAIALTFVGERYAKMTKPFLGLYTMYLGFRILQNAFKKTTIVEPKRKTNITLLGLIGGFIDSFGGGGWGPLVTGSFIKNGHTPRYIIGSSTVTKFILTVASAITFIITVGIHHWNIVAGLLIGGVITAPFSAMLTSKLPVKKMFLIVGIVVIILSAFTVIKALF